MLGVRGRAQREGDVIHVIAEHLRDMTAELRAVSGLGGSFPIVPRRGDEAKGGGSGPDSCYLRPVAKTRNIYVPDLRVGSGIIPGRAPQGSKIKSRNFR